MLATCTRVIPGSALVVRPHPHEWLPVVRFMNPGVHLCAAMTASEAILAADVLVTHSSFMAVEAVLLGRPAVVVSPDRIPNLLPLIVEGLVTLAFTREELCTAVEDLLRVDDSPLRAAQERFRLDQAHIAGVDHAAKIIASLARVPGGSAPMPAGVSERVNA